MEQRRGTPETGAGDLLLGLPGQPVPFRLGEATTVDCGQAHRRDDAWVWPGEVCTMLGERLGESSGKFTGIRVLPSEGGQVWLEVSFQGRGTLLGREITDTGTYRQTFRPGGLLSGDGHLLLITDAGDVAEWVGGGVGRSTGPGYQASFGVYGSFPSATGPLSPLAEVADVTEYEVDSDGSYHWTMWAWTGAGAPSIPRQQAQTGAMA